MAKEQGKKRSKKYDPKLSIEGSFEDVIKVSLNQPSTQNMESNKRKDRFEKTHPATNIEFLFERFEVANKGNEVAYTVTYTDSKGTKESVRVKRDKKGVWAVQKQFPADLADFINRTISKNESAG